MAENILNKKTNGQGTASIRNFKDIFPDQIETVYVYKGINLVSRESEVFAREDDLSIISLEFKGKIEGVFGGEVFAVQPNTIEEEKRIKEIELVKFSTAGFTAFLDDVDIDLTEENLYYTIGKQFSQQDINDKRLDVFVDQQLIPGTLQKFLPGDVSLSDKQKTIASGETVTFTFVPAETQNNMPSSTIRFVDSKIYKPLPSEQPKFRITHIEIKSDMSFLPEWGNGIKVRGVVQGDNGVNETQDLEYLMDKPLLPLQIIPYAGKGDLEFGIGNFNKFARIPWIYAKDFLSTTRNIEDYIARGNNAKYVKDLHTAVLNMFKLSWAYGNGFSSYRDKNGDILDEKIGNVSLKALEGKERDISTIVNAVDSILNDWAFNGYSKYKKSPEYLRVQQLLAASSEWVLTSHGYSATGFTEYHKTLLDWWVDLDTNIDKDTAGIEMSLKSNKYKFTFEQVGGLNNYDKPIINLIPLESSSNVVVFETDRYSSLPEIDDPISLDTFVSKPGDVNTRTQDGLKYFVGADITDPKMIADFFINSESTNQITSTHTKSFDTDWYPNRISDGSDSSEWPTDASTFATWNFPSGGGTGGDSIVNGLVPNQHIGSQKIGLFRIADPITAAKQGVGLPSGAYDIRIINQGVKQDKTMNLNAWERGSRTSGEGTYSFELERYTGVLIEYKISTTSHSTVNKQFAYDKGSLTNMIINYSGENIWTRNYYLNKNWKKPNGQELVKVKEINRIYLSFIFGNYVDIILHYSYESPQTGFVQGSTAIPRIKLPSLSDERRTKLGIRL